MSTVFASPSNLSPWQSALGLEPGGTLGLIDQVEQGLEAESFARFADATALSRDELAQVTGVSRRTVERRKEKGEPLDAVLSERLVRLADLYALAERVLGSGAAAKTWMRGPRHLFGGKTPLEMTATGIGADEVRKLLLRTEHGVFS